MIPKNVWKNISMLYKRCCCSQQCSSDHFMFSEIKFIPSHCGQNNLCLGVFVSCVLEDLCFSWDFYTWKFLGIPFWGGAVLLGFVTCPKLNWKMTQQLITALKHFSLSSTFKFSRAWMIQNLKTSWHKYINLSAETQRNLLIQQSLFSLKELKGGCISQDYFWKVQ